LPRNCLLKHTIKGEIEDRGRRGISCEQLVNDLKETKGCWKLKGVAVVALSGEFAVEEAMDLL
jgi:hypothetical protein